MLAHFLSYWDAVRRSLWALPLTIAALCAGLAFLTLNLELPWASHAAWLYAGSAQQAPEFAASLVGAMITLTALAFSITMIVLTLAAQQLGPRLIHLFMSDRGTQSALGLFLGTVIYLLLVLRALDGDAYGRAPNLAITGGTALVLASIVALLFFVHALASSIVSDHVIARVGAALDDAIGETFPKEPQDAPAPPEGGAAISLRTRGYVQRIDYKALARAACRCDAQIVLAYHAGRHVIDGETDAWILGADAEQLRRELERAIVIAQQRSEGQDPEWSCRQLVEVGLRALSPGINDEFTAIAVIDRLSRALALLLVRYDAARVWLDSDGAPRVFGPAPTSSLMLGAAFDQIREAGAGKHRVMLSLAENLRKLAIAAHPRHANVLAKQLDLLESAARRSLLESARAEVQGMVNTARAALQGNK